MLVTSPSSTRARWRQCGPSLPGLAHVLVTGERAHRGHDGDWGRSWPRPRPTSRSRRPTPEDLALLHFTSGTTGRPKGAIHVHEAVVAHHVTGRYALDLHARRHLLVHGRSRLGHRHQLRHHRAADQRRDQPRGRGRVRCRALVSDARRTKGDRLVHRADRHPHADEARQGRRSRGTTSPPALHGAASASRSTRRRWSGARRPSACRSTTIGGRPRPAAS